VDDLWSRRPLGVDGRLVRAQVEGVIAHEAVDRLEARLRHRLERAGEHWEARRGALPADGPHEWRHESEPTHSLLDKMFGIGGHPGPTAGIALKPFRSSVSRSRGYPATERAAFS